MKNEVFSTAMRYQYRLSWTKNRMLMSVLCAAFLMLHAPFFISSVMAQSLTGRAPGQVAVGEQFRLSYTVNTDAAKDFRAGNIPDAFDVLMASSRSRSRRK